MFSQLPLWLTYFGLLPSVVLSLPPQHHAKAAKPVYFLLAGDSTTATQSANGGGWGDGFLNYTLLPPSSGHNHGHNGATTVSFRAGGDWGVVLAQAKNKTGSGVYGEVFVTIQFGHNDQKAAANISLAEYQSNLQTFAEEVKGVGAIPILVTPLTRRSFTGTPPRIVENLATQRNLTIQAALSTASRYIDLNAASTAYCNEIGPDASWKYNLNPTDYTHLNVWGSVVFGRIVSDLMTEKYKDIRVVTRKNETLTWEIEEGVPARKL